MVEIAGLSEGLAKSNSPNKVQKERKDLEKEKQNFLTFFC